MRLDPDHKKCSDLYKSLRKLSKLLERMNKASNEQNFAECISAANQVMNHDKNSHFFKHRGLSFICSCNSRAKNTNEAVKACSEVITSNPNDAEALYYRAQAYIVDELLDQG